MYQGIIFDIKEFSVHDGPGVRQTVFFKGCPLRCNWCHNPEGLSMQPQLLVRRSACIRCGACASVCRSAVCTACGRCIPVCPVRARSLCGETLSSDALASKLLRNTALYAQMGGGVTFSGGEPLMQPDFLLETASALHGVHLTIETAGFAERNVFLSAVKAVDTVMMDLKLIDSALHRRFTGRDNACILDNLEQLCAGSKPFLIRIPLIPGVTDTEENLSAAAKLLRGARALTAVELLPYNRMAGAKYDWLGAVYAPMFDPEQPVQFRHDLFQKYGIESRGR